ncbi:MAG TPA: arylamine N-acetyltransferase [Burkholderiales bacterium]|nr:arylamine N-acetyltransferase [Burkholderiales bacterium]
MAEGFLDLYFERIGYGGSAAVNLQTLRDLHLLHLQSIPYENLDVFCHQGVRLDPEALTRKILLRRRGGYCFEQNGLFAAALAALGFRSHANLARVHRNRPQPGGRTHHINLVELDGHTWVCDVGFGGSGFREPLRLEADVEVEQLGETYRLHESAEHGFYLQKRMDGAWQPFYTFKVDPALPIDLAMSNFYTSNSDDHVFRGAILGTRLTPRGRVTLSDHTFKIFDLLEGTITKNVVTDFAAYIDRLREHLGVELNDAETGLLKNRFAVLKPPGTNE